MSNYNGNNPDQTPPSVQEAVADLTVFKFESSLSSFEQNLLTWSTEDQKKDLTGMSVEAVAQIQDDLLSELSRIRKIEKEASRLGVLIENLLHRDASRR